MFPFFYAKGVMYHSPGLQGLWQAATLEVNETNPENNHEVLLPSQTIGMASATTNGIVFLVSTPRVARKASQPWAEIHNAFSVKT